MALDTKQFDEAITNLNSQLASKQADLDIDSFAVSQKAYNDKVAAIRLIEDKIATVNTQKAQAIDAQDKLDGIDVTKAQLVQQITDIKASIPQ